MSVASGAGMYRRPEIVAYYDRQQDLQGAERLLFDRYVKPGAEILDLGVGAGRTTPHLARIASRYVGVGSLRRDGRALSGEVPDLEVLQLDATDLSAIEAGILRHGCFLFQRHRRHSHCEGRRRCLAECARVLRSNGCFLFSVHNPRYLVFAPQLDGVGPMRAAWRLSYAALHTAACVATRLPSTAFWRGSGYVFDPMGPAIAKIYVAAPDEVSRELAEAGLVVDQRVPGQFPRGGGRFRTPWYYYACVKRGD